MVAPQLERFLEAPLRSLAARAEKVVLIETAGLTLHRYRESGLWPPAGGSHGGHGTEPEAQTALAERGGHQGHGHAGGEHDPHIWLDPDNARILTGRIAAALSAAFPEHAALYARNAAQTAQRLDALRQEMTAQLSPLAGIPFLVFHDAFQYLEKRFSLSSVGALALDPARQPGAARIAQIRRAIARLGVACIFSEPQFRPGLIRQIVRDTGVRSGVLDPLGVGLESGPDLYFLMMRGNAEALRACLQGAN
ncbi:MAG: zinc ABC transporter substrate-binding protein ZnuA [Methyloligellaceae bacterium]